MNIHSGLDYTYKVKQSIQDCILKTKDNPFSRYIFVVDDPKFFEEILLKYTDALFSIEITTYTTLLESLLLQNNIPTKKVSRITQILTLKKIMLENPTIFNQGSSLYAIIDELLVIFHELHHGCIDKVDTSKLKRLSKEKIEACLFLYHKFIALLPDAFSFVNQAKKVCSHTNPDDHYIFITEKIINPLDLSFIKKLDIYNDVTLLINYQNDTRSLNTVFSSYFENTARIEDAHINPYKKRLLQSLYANTKINKPIESPLYILKETTPNHEIKNICYRILKNIVDHNMRYKDFAIYYPNPSYLEPLLKTLQAFGIPYNSIKEENYSKEFQACLLILQYASSLQIETWIDIIDTLTLKAYCSYTSINYIKKQYQEYDNVKNNEYKEYYQHIMNSYIMPLHHASSLQDIMNILVTFIQVEMISTDALIQVQAFFTSLQEYDDPCTIQECIELIDLVKPSFTIQTKDIQDHLYIFSLQQPYSDLLDIKQSYLLGVNETIVPSAINNQGILLNKERIHIQPLATIDKQLAYQQNQILTLLASNTSSFTLSYSLVSNSGETLLSSSLLSQLQDLFICKSVENIPIYYHDAVLTNLYASGGIVGNKEIVNQMIEQYCNTKNQPPILSNKACNNTLSASQLETYNGCPYKYFQQYTLQIQPWNQPILQANELGSLVHHIIENNSDCFKNQQTANQFLIDKLPKRIHQQMQSYLEAHPIIQNKANHPYNQYFLQCLKQDLYTTICILVDHMKVSSFSLNKTEKKVMYEYGDFKIKGIIDRVDTFREYIKIIDYKSSNKELDLSLAMQGFNMQMLIYMDMVSKLENASKGALLYFNTKKRILKSEASILEDVDSDTFYKEYRMNGYVDENVIEDIDATIEGSSKIIKAKYVKSKEGYSGNILNQDHFQCLIDKINEHIYQLYQSMANGNIAIAPKGSLDASIFTKVNPCTYCPYHALCNYDVFYNEYVNVEKLDVEAILGGDQND